MMLGDAADEEYERACRARDAWLEEGGLLVSTDHVADETLTLLRVRLGLDAARRWSDSVTASPRMRWEWIDAVRAEKARDWFFEWEDRDFSFTDCTTFVVMRERRLRKALASDRHFTQAGFERLPG